MTKKLISLALAAVLILSSVMCSFGASSGALPVGKNGNFVEIPMTGSVGAVITLGQGSVNKDMNASDHIAAGAKSKGNVIASVNGALFNGYYNAKATLTFPDNCARTYGAVIINGQSVKGAGTTPMLGFTSDGKALIDRVKVNVTMKLRRTTNVGMWAVNDYYNDATSIVLITPECGYSVPLQAGAVVVHVKNGVVDSVDEKATSATCASDEKLVVYNSGAWANAKKYTLEPKKGNSAEIVTALTPDRTANQAAWDKVVTAVGVSPWLLQGGKDVFDQNGTMEAKMAKDYTAQRTFAAVKADGTLMIGETSGTFEGIINYLQGQGYVDAIALDGGSSSMLNVGGSYMQNAGRKLTNVIHIVDYGSSALPQKAAGVDIVTPSNWATGFIDFATANGLIPAKFDMAAKQNITRAEFCQLAYTLVEKMLTPSDLTYKLNTCGITYAEAEAQFTDIGNDYHNVIVQAYRLGMVSGKGEGKFDPFACITRQEAAALLTNTATKVLGIEATGEGMEFADAAKFGSWAPTFIDFVVRAGIMAGTGANFNPLGFFTKEQAVTTFVNIYQR